MKRKLVYLGLICICVTALLGCSQLYKQNNNRENILDFSNFDIQSITCSIQDINKDINVSITYPQIANNLENTLIAEINTMLYEAFMIGAIEDGIFYDAEYEVMAFSSDIISVINKGDVFYKGGAYPTRFFKTINIDPSQLSIIDFDDAWGQYLLAIADENEGNVYFVEGIRALLDVYTYSELIEMYLGQVEKYFYMTNNNMGIVLMLNHASGDYAVLEITGFNSDSPEY